MTETEYPQPLVKPYWVTPTVPITNNIIRRYLVARKVTGAEEIEFGYLLWDDDEGVLVFTDDYTSPLNVRGFDYWDIIRVFQHAHYIQRELGISGVRVVTATGGCGDDDLVYDLYEHQNIGWNPRGHYIMVPKQRARSFTRKLLRHLNKSERDGE